MDMYMINETIEELENSDTNFSNCDKLAMLYIIKDHYKKYPPVLRGLCDEVLDELNDISPQYNNYCELKRRYQNQEITKDAMVRSLMTVCAEIEEFMLILYRASDTEEERELLKQCVNSLYNKI